jgi:predicted alpha/beta superfamily hydrolase
VVIESSGAQYGYLLIEEEGRLAIRAESRVTGKQAVQTSNRTLEEAGAAVVLRIAPGGHERTVWEGALRPMLETLAGGAGEQP